MNKEDSALERRREINRRAASKSRRRQKEQIIAANKVYHERKSRNTILTYEKLVLKKERQKLIDKVKEHASHCPQHLELQLFLTDFPEDTWKTDYDDIDLSLEDFMKLENIEENFEELLSDDTDSLLDYFKITEMVSDTSFAGSTEHLPAINEENNMPPSLSENDLELCNIEDNDDYFETSSTKLTDNILSLPEPDVSLEKNWNEICGNDSSSIDNNQYTNLEWYGDESTPTTNVANYKRKFSERDSNSPCIDTSKIFATSSDTQTSLDYSLAETEYNSPFEHPFSMPNLISKIADLQYAADTNTMNVSHQNKDDNPLIPPSFRHIIFDNAQGDKQTHSDTVIETNRRTRNVYNPISNSGRPSYIPHTSIAPLYSSSPNVYFSQYASKPHIATPKNPSHPIQRIQPREQFNPPIKRSLSCESHISPFALDTQSEIYSETFVKPNYSLEEESIALNKTKSFSEYKNIDMDITLSSFIQKSEKIHPKKLRTKNVTETARRVPIPALIETFDASYGDDDDD